MNLTTIAARVFPLVLSFGLLPATSIAQDAAQSALARCLDQAGAVDFSLPVSPEKLAAIRTAQPACDAAIAQGTATAEVHFLMGMLQQSEGALANAMDHYRQAAWLAMHQGTEVAHASIDPAPQMQPAEAPDVAENEAESTPEIAAAGDDAQSPDSPATAAPTADDFRDRPPLEGCTALAGPPDSGVPVSPAALDATLTALKAARPFCERAVADGSADAAAFFQLAVLMQVEGNHQKALEYFGRAAEMGLAAAHSKLGDYFLFGIGPVKADLDKAVAHFKKAEAGGDLAATTTLAFLYRLGRGVPRDPAQMMMRMKKAADGGYQFAQYRLAQTYLTGDGIPGGVDEALGVPNPELGAKYLEMAARQGNSKAILELAQLYADDAGGVAADPAAHVLWTEKAAETGDPAAIAALGYLHETGNGVERDPALAAALYVKALESGKISLADLRRGADGNAPRWDKETARAFQTILRDRGLYDGAIDGIVGPVTAAAARRLRR